MLTVLVLNNALAGLNETKTVDVLGTIVDVTVLPYRIVALGSSAARAIPLPAFDGVRVNNVAITEQDGYLVIDGEVE